MPFSVSEFKTSRRVMLAKDSESATLEYVGYGADDDAVARAGFSAVIPATFTAFTNPLKLLDWDCWTEGGLFWRATAHFGPDNAPLFPDVGIVGPPAPVAAAPGLNTPLGPDYSFDFTGVTERITQSKETIARKNRNGGAGEDNKQAIGITADGEVEGCERISPNLEWSRTVTFASITTGYINVVVGLVGTVNNNTFYGRPKGTSLFMGGNCQIDDTRKAKVTFKFLDRPNLTTLTVSPGFNLTLADTLVGPRAAIKEGHEYLWVSYGDVPGVRKLVQVPVDAYVERIYDYGDFSGLRIGV